MSSSVFVRDVSLKKGECVSLPDEVSICLDSFGHKRPRVGGATMATAYLRFMGDGRTPELRLSRHGREGASPALDELRIVHRGPYEIRPTKFDYDRSVTFTITKHRALSVEYGKTFKLESGRLALFPDDFGVRLLRFGEESSVRFAELEVVANAESIHSTKLYASGATANGGRSTADPGVLISGRLIQLRSTLAGPSVDLEVRAPSERSKGE